MDPNYTPPDFSDRTASPKPLKGTHTLDAEQVRATARAVERVAKSLAKNRDGFKCRWPEKHVCRGELEAAHLIDASLGGLMVGTNLVTLCAWILRRGPESVHSKALKIEAETALGADGALSFWRRTGPSEYVLVARELRPFQIERD